MLITVDCSHKLEKLYSLMEKELKKHQSDNLFYIIFKSTVKGMVNGFVEIVKEQCVNQIWYKAAYIGGLLINSMF
jgi:hypothetical protein